MNNTHNDHIASLYGEFKQKLHDDTLVMQDDILKTLIKIEHEVHAILNENKGQIWMHPRREDLYNLSEKGEQHFHTQVAKEAQIMENIVGHGQSIQHMLGAIARRQERIKDLLSHEDYLAICKKLGIFYTRHTDGATKPFVPTDPSKAGPKPGDGTGMEIKNTSEPKFLNLLSLLRSIETEAGGNIDTRDIMVDFQSETPDTMIRHLPYIIVRIPRLNRTIILNDRVGEATFVLQGLIDIDTLRQTHKSELEHNFGAKRVIYNAAWESTLRKYLLHNWEITPQTQDSSQQHETLTGRNTIKGRVKMEIASLFSDTEIIRKDLENFRVACGVRALAELSSSNGGKEAKLTNGQTMKWQAYLNNASNYLLGTKQGDKENSPRPGEALEELKIRIGVSSRIENPLSEEYFRNTAYIARDLESFRVACGVGALAELSASTKYASTEAKITNGQTMKWNTYLVNASNYLLGTKHRDKENSPRPGEALEELKIRIGVSSRIENPLSEEYFRNTAYIARDLESFRVACGVGALAELSASTKYASTEAKITNGQTMKWQTYLNNASNYLLGTKNHHKENPPRQGEALEELKIRIGVSSRIENPLSEEYFRNTAYIARDLESFRVACGVRALAELSSSNGGKEAKITNGQTMKWQTYLYNASNYLLGTKHRDKENPPRRGEALSLLKRIANSENIS